MDDCDPFLILLGTNILLRRVISPLPRKAYVFSASWPTLTMPWEEFRHIFNLVSPSISFLLNFL